MSEPLSLLDRRGDEVGDHRLRRPGQRRGWARLRRARRPGRGLRQRRHAVEREAAADPAGLHDPAARPARRRRPDPARPAAVQGGLRGRPALDGRRDGEALPRRRQRPPAARWARSRRPSTPSTSRTTTRRCWPSSTRPRTRRSGAPTGSAGTRRWWSCCSTWRSNGFTTYIASGGDRDFMRPVAGDLYGIPPERVIGSALGLELPQRQRHAYVALQGRDGLLRRRPEKPVRIWSRIGRRPILVRAATPTATSRCSPTPAGTGRPRFGCCCCTTTTSASSSYTAGAEQALDVAGQQGWTVVSMKNDWTQVFPSAP